MVAYSFKQQFSLPIETGRKRQTIRADRKRHARPGEELQLYTGMRTTSCRLLGRTTCLDVSPVTLRFDRSEGERTPALQCLGRLRFAGEETFLDAFARQDGFDDWGCLRAFWAINYPDIERFEGVLIRWGDLHG